MSEYKEKIFLTINEAYNVINEFDVLSIPG